VATAIRSHSFVEDLISSASNPAELSVVTTHKPGALLYAAGDQVPAPGSYWIWHHHHRSPHSAKVRFTVFPKCAQCGNNVRYLSMQGEPTATEWLRRDPDFKHALTGRANRKS
jgi:hypothetical protein